MLSPLSVGNIANSSSTDIDSRGISYNDNDSESVEVKQENKSII